MVPSSTHAHTIIHGDASLLLSSIESGLSKPESTKALSGQLKECFFVLAGRRGGLPLLAGSSVTMRFSGLSLGVGLGDRLPALDASDCPASEFGVGGEYSMIRLRAPLSTESSEWFLL